MGIRAGFLGTGSCLPDKEVTNFDLEKIVDTNDEWIRTRTGISARRIADDQTATSDLAFGASIKAMEAAGVTAEELDMIIVATITPDNSFPSTACTLQDKLGAVNASAFDVSAACSGFVYASTVAMQFVESGAAKNILVVGAETLSKILDFTDRNTCVLFGDGAGAAIISATENKDEAIVDVQCSSDGNLKEILYIPGAGSGEEMYMHMKGNETFKIAVKTLTSDVKKIMEKNNYTNEDIDLFVPHQANYRIIKAVGDALKFKDEQKVLTVEKYGNTSSASIPMAMNECFENGRMKKGQIILLDAFGGGATWGSALIKFNG